LPQTILVADDEPDIRNLARKILENNGYQVSVVANGVEALQRAEAEMPDLILLDILMPGKNGWEVCEILKSAERTKGISIIMFSASHGDEFGKRRAVEAGADGYLTKPFNASELLVEVRKHLIASPRTGGGSLIHS
jgi:CheY-like chemotaxis protein